MATHLTPAAASVASVSGEWTLRYQILRFLSKNCGTWDTTTFTYEKLPIKRTAFAVGSTTLADGQAQISHQIGLKVAKMSYTAT